jgi:hypothetical protein
MLTCAVADDGLGDLQTMLQRAEALSRVLERAQAISPGSARGTDGCGEILAVIGPEGLPESTHVGAKSLRNVGSEAFGDTMTAAFTAAMRWPGATTGRFDDSSASPGWSVVAPPRR